MFLRTPIGAVHRRPLGETDEVASASGKRAIPAKLPPPVTTARLMGSLARWSGNLERARKVAQQLRAGNGIRGLQAIGQRPRVAPLGLEQHVEVNAISSGSAA